MKVIILGATGMVGQGVLRECLRDSEVSQVGQVMIAVARYGAPTRLLENRGINRLADSKSKDAE